MDDKRYYSLRDKDGNEASVFSGRNPRTAALKAATRGITDIRLREHKRTNDGKWRVHVFKGERKEIEKPANAPAWMPDKIWKPNVKKTGVEKVDSI